LVRQPEPMEKDEDFVYQTFHDLLLRAPSQEEQNDYASRIGNGDLARDRFLFELLDPTQDPNLVKASYQIVRNVILTHQLLFDVWPDRERLLNDARIIADSGFVAYISSMMPAFEAVYVDEVNRMQTELQLSLLTPITGVPDNLSPVKQRSAFITYLFMKKYGVLPTAPQLDRGLLQFRSNLRDGFTAAFIADVEVVATSTAYISSGLAFRFDAATPPDDTYLRRANAASLLINLLRIGPTEEEVEALAGKLFAAQVAEVLADPRYVERFQMLFPEVEHHADGWKYVSWFGWFRDVGSPWVFHEDLGWIHVNEAGQSSGNLWFHDTELGWTWTSEERYPLMYSRNKAAWLRPAEAASSSTGGRRWFYNYNAAGWTSY
jgi:hypothetical protein